jgi:hypothetical protein
MFIFVTLYIELTFYISSLPLPVIVGNNQTKLLPPEFINCKFEKHFKMFKILSRKHNKNYMRTVDNTIKQVM